MGKKFIEFLEAAALIILTGVIVVGVIKYIDSREEPKEETPIIEELPGEEQPGEDDGVLSLNIYYWDDSNNQPSSDYVSIQYEDGMTWEEWANSKYNSVGARCDSDFVEFNINGSVAYLYMTGDGFIPGSGAPDITPDLFICDNVCLH